MKRTTFIVAGVGLIVAILVIGWVGLPSLGRALATAGWGGLIFLSAFWLALFGVLGSAWYLLAPKSDHPKLWVYFWGRTVRDSATELLPFSQLGGLVVGARAIILQGVTMPFAFASTVVDLTAEMLSQIAFTILGLVLLATHLSNLSFDNPWVIGSVLGVLAAIAAATAFVVFQIRGGAVVGQMLKRLLPNVAGQAEAVDAALQEIYAHPARLALSSSVHFVAWILGVVGVWILLKMMHAPIDFLGVVAIESILAAVRSIGFAIPSGAGVQEAAYVLVGRLFGLTSETALALSLLKRGRDLVIGVPTLVLWQVIEGGRLFGKGKAARAALPLEDATGIERGREDARSGRLIDHDAAMDELDAAIAKASSRKD
jgi:putative membrane protein